MKRNKFSNPSKRTLLVFAVLWLVGVILLTAAITILFAEDFFQIGYAMIYFLLFASTFVLVKLYFNYRNK